MGTCSLFTPNLKACSWDYLAGIDVDESLKRIIDIDEEALKEMVCDVNNLQVDEKDRLSYCVYKYNRQADTIDVAA